MGTYARTRGRGRVETVSGPVRTSVPLSIEDHARLAALAAMARRGVGDMASELLAAALRGVVVQDRRQPVQADDGPAS